MAIDRWLLFDQLPKGPAFSVCVTCARIAKVADKSVEEYQS